MPLFEAFLDVEAAQPAVEAENVRLQAPVIDTTRLRRRAQNSQRFVIGKTFLRCTSTGRQNRTYMDHLLAPKGLRLKLARQASAPKPNVDVRRRGCHLAVPGWLGAFLFRSPPAVGNVCSVQLHTIQRHRSATVGATVHKHTGLSGTTLQKSRAEPTCSHFVNDGHGGSE